MKGRLSSEVRKSIINLLIGVLTGSIVTSTYYFLNYFLKNLEIGIGFILKCIVYYLIMITTYRDLFILYSRNYYTTKIFPIMLQREQILFNIRYLVLFLNLIGYLWWSFFLIGNISFKIGEFEITYWHIFLGICFFDGINTLILKWRVNETFTYINEKNEKLNKFQEELKKWLIYDSLLIIISTIAIVLNWCVSNPCWLNVLNNFCLGTIGLLIFLYFTTLDQYFINLFKNN